MLNFILLTFLAFNSYAQTCISHRLNSGGPPENSLEALESAVERSFTGIEFDIRITKDGIPLLYHDSKLKDGLIGSACPLGKKIKRLNYKQIFDKCFLENGAPLATFEEALAIIVNYDGHIFIDLKQRPSHEFYRLIEESNLIMNKKVRFLSFKKRVLKALRKKWPNSQTILLSRFIPRGLFYRKIGFNKRLSFFAQLYHWFGKDISIWNLNDEHDIQKAIQRKIDFIITDKYQLCSQNL